MTANFAGRRFAVSALVLTVLAGGCSPEPPRSEPVKTGPVLSAWGSCPEPPPDPDARLECATIAVPYATEAGHFQQAGVPTVVCGPGRIDQAHQPDEYIEIEQISACIDFMRRLGSELSA